MPTEVRVPALGESVVEATVGTWLKREGEAVEAVLLGHAASHGRGMRAFGHGLSSRLSSRLGRRRR